jgi:hypothetical protein
MANIIDNIQTGLTQGIPIKVEVDTKIYVKLAVTILIVATIITLALILYRRFK